MAIVDDYFSKKTMEQVKKLYGDSTFGTALIEYHDKEKKEGMIDTKRNPIIYVGDEHVSRKVKEEIHPRLCDLSDFVKSDIVWVTCHSNRLSVPKQVDDRMHIMSMMTPAWVDFTRKKIDTYTINGETWLLPPGQMDYLDPTLNEIPGCDGIFDDAGFLMALMVGYNIYILNDCMHCKNPESLKVAIIVFEHIINKAVKLWKECEDE